MLATFSILYFQISPHYCSTVLHWNCSTVLNCTTTVEQLSYSSALELNRKLKEQVELLVEKLITKNFSKINLLAVRGSHTVTVILPQSPECHYSSTASYLA
jgi:hypothetical protein